MAAELNADWPQQVEGEAQGEEGVIGELMKDLDKGPSGAQVVKLTQESREVVPDESSFTVRH